MENNRDHNTLYPAVLGHATACYIAHIVCRLGYVRSLYSILVCLELFLCSEVWDASLRSLYVNMFKVRPFFHLSVAGVATCNLGLNADDNNRQKNKMIGRTCNTQDNPEIPNLETPNPNSLTPLNSIREPHCTMLALPPSLRPCIYIYM